MKVIHILHELKFSGAEIMYVDAAPIFQQKGCDLTVVATAKELGEFAPYFERAGYKVLHMPLPELKNYFHRMKYYASFIKHIKNENYDVIHIHSPRAMWGISFCGWMANIKSVFTFHSVYPTRTLTYVYHILLRWSAKQIFKCSFHSISDSVFDHEIKLYGNRTTKIYNWYGNNRYFPANDEEKAIVRRELGIDQKSFVLISVGGCGMVKRHTEIINALPHILETLPNCLYLHLGKGDTESEEKELAQKLGIQEHIRFYGNQEDVRRYLIASDLYLMTSRYEGIPITAIEAMACQIPTILYNVPGLRDFNRNDENSFLIEEDYRILAEKVLIVQANFNKSSEIAKRANRFVNTNFNMQTNVNQIFNLYIK